MFAGETAHQNMGLPCCVTFLSYLTKWLDSLLFSVGHFSVWPNLRALSLPSLCQVYVSSKMFYLYV